MSDTKITIIIPKAKATNIIDGFVYQYNYQNEIQNPKNTKEEEMIPNPQSKKDFSSEKIKEFIRESYRAYKATEADSARQTVISDADNYTDDITVV